MKNLAKLLTFGLFIILASCGSKSSGGGGTNPPPTPTVADLVKKSWTVTSASWDNVLQFESTSSSNIVSGYSVYKLDLTSSTAKLTEFDGTSYTGSYNVSSDEKTLNLTGLTSSNGAPSGTNGNISFTIVTKPTATSITIQTTANYVKASNKVVKLVLKTT